MVPERSLLNPRQQYQSPPRPKPSGPPRAQQPPQNGAKPDRFQTIADNLQQMLTAEKQRRRNTTKIKGWINMEDKIGDSINDLKSTCPLLSKEMAIAIGKILYSLKLLKEEYSCRCAKDYWTRASFDQLVEAAVVGPLLTPHLMRDARDGFDLAKYQYAKENGKKTCTAKAGWSRVRFEEPN